jgi:hypothetical protein
MQYTTTINDESVYGITAAREAYNTSLQDVDGKPNPERLERDDAYLDFVLHGAVQSWCKQYAPVVVPEVPATTVNGVPQTVTFRQGKNFMELSPHPVYGDLWTAANTLAEAIDDRTQRIITLGYLRDSQSYEYPRVLVMAQSLLGMTEDQVKQMFIAAAKL